MRKINKDMLIIIHHYNGIPCVTVISLPIGQLNVNINYLNIEYNEYEDNFAKFYIKKGKSVKKNT